MSGRLWFHIESVFSELHRLCREARSAELKGKADDGKPAWMQGGTGMGASAFDSVTDNLTIEAPAPFHLAGTFDLDESEPAVVAPKPRGADVVVLRAELRKRLNWLKSKLAETLTEREVYYTLFPIVIYADELVQSSIEGRASAWQPFQRELYEIDNGGEMFYTAIETLLKKDETLPLIFEVFYFCLNDGFSGQHAGDRAKIEEYKARLAFRIPVERPASPGADGSGEVEVELVEFPRRYYAAAIAVVFGAFVLFRLFSFLRGTSS